RLAVEPDHEFVQEGRTDAVSDLEQDGLRLIQEVRRHHGKGSRLPQTTRNHLGDAVPDIVEHQGSSLGKLMVNLHDLFVHVHRGRHTANCLRPAVRGQEKKGRLAQNRPVLAQVISGAEVWCGGNYVVNAVAADDGKAGLSERAKLRVDVGAGRHRRRVV